MKELGAGSRKLYSASSWLIPSLPLAIAFLTWCNGLNGTEPWLIHRPNVRILLEWVRGASFTGYAVFGMLLLWAACYKRLGDPWHASQLQFILDKYQNGAFNNEEGLNLIPQDHNRVTLFRYQRCWTTPHWTAKKWYWPWGEHRPVSYFLVPVLRSGHMSKNSKAVFYVSDSSDETEGIGGRAWVTNQIVFEQSLPDVHENSSEKTIKNYAKRTSVSSDLVRKRIQDKRVMPRSMLAIPVSRFGTLWGVVVLDSRYPEGVKQSAAESYQLTIALIERLLEKAS